MSNIITVVIDGIAYGMLLFLLAVGLSVTLGLMRFINLAHGAFAIGGGYLADADEPRRFALSRRASDHFRRGGARWAGVGAERDRHLYRVSALRQVLFTIGFAFAMSAFATILFGPHSSSLCGYPSGSPPASRYLAWKSPAIVCS